MSVSRLLVGVMPVVICLHGWSVCIRRVAGVKVLPGNTAVRGKGKAAGECRSRI